MSLCKNRGGGTMNHDKLRRYVMKRDHGLFDLRNEKLLEPKDGYIVDTDLHTLVILPKNLDKKKFAEYILAGAYFFDKNGYFLRRNKTDDGMIILTISVYFKFKTKAMNQAKMYKLDTIYDCEKEEEITV